MLAITAYNKSLLPIGRQRLFYKPFKIISKQMIEINLGSYTIRLFVPEGNSHSFKIMDKIN